MLEKIKAMFEANSLPKGDGVFFMFNEALASFSSDELFALREENKGKSRAEFEKGNVRTSKYHEYLGIRINLTLKKRGINPARKP